MSTPLYDDEPMGLLGPSAGIKKGPSWEPPLFFFKYIADLQTFEALVIRDALALSEDLYLRRIHVASDCKGVVEEVRKENAASYGAVIHEIVDHSLSFDFCKFSHEFRSLNYEAHNLANHALTLGDGRHVWLGHPGNLSFVPVNVVTG